MDFLILALATFRMSSLIADEDGPLGLFEWVRGKMGVQRDERGENYGTNNFAVGLVCQWCNSVWIGVILAILYMWLKEMVVLICLPLALSTVTMILARYIDG
jgi:hypothetical protein